MSAFDDMLMSVGRSARGLSQVTTLAHVYCAALERCTFCETVAARDACAELKSQVIRSTKLPSIEPGRFPISFDPRAAERSFDSFVASLQSRARLADDMLRWLLTGDFKDNTQERCRSICQEYGIIALLSTTGAGDIAAGAGGLGARTRPVFGQVIDDDWLHRETSQELLNRDGDLKKHVGRLALAVLSGRHYLITGAPGVGKSLFVRHLLAHTIKRWRRSSDQALNAARFLFVDRGDFLCADEEVRNRLAGLHAYLNGHPDVVPVFDGFELFITPSLTLSEHFSQYFGAALASHHRTFLLVCRSAEAGLSLRGIQPNPLPGLSPEATQPIVEKRLQHRIGESDLRLEVDGGIPLFSSRLLNLAVERYPGRAFPEVAIHLIDSAVVRAQERVLFSRTGPLDRLLFQDLWEHVAEEQGLSVEILGKDPTAFYSELAQRLKGVVIGQDHAVDTICRVLTLQASMPPKKTPRGRFLFVGPPGVGKSHLGRCLARMIGYGEEAFFRYNMADFGSEGDRWRFIGSAPGYKGHGEVRTIFDEVRERPSCVILLDEIDRAHAAIQDILLSILEGEGKDGSNHHVYFSQAVFLMTTNHGQDQVATAYEESVYRGAATRMDLAARFDDTSLRSLLLEGALDATEMAMRARVESDVQAVKVGIASALQDSDGEQEIDLAMSEYLRLRELSSRLERAASKTPIDRAFLDRIDFVIPFFPLKEPALLRRILDLKLSEAAWTHCPEQTRRCILEEALLQKESVRPLERLILKYRSRDSIAPSPTPERQ